MPNSAGAAAGMLALVAAAILFLLGLVLPVGENDYVYWEIRGPLWALGALSLLVAIGAFLSRPIEEDTDETPTS